MKELMIFEGHEVELLELNGEVLKVTIGNQK